MGRQSEEEYLLKQVKHRSYIDPNDQSDIPGKNRSFKGLLWGHGLKLYNWVLGLGREHE